MFSFTRGELSKAMRRVAQCLSTTIMFAVTGCASLGEPSLHGEQASYHVFNDTGRGPIFSPRLFDADRQSLLYANLGSGAVGVAAARSGSWVSAAQGSARPVQERSYANYDAFGKRLAGRYLPPNLFELDPADETMMLPRVLAGAFRPAGPVHRIPATVSLQWRLPATPGQGYYNGDLVGPVRLILRASIPPPVLDRLSKSWRYRLELAIGASMRESRVFWRLRQVTDEGMQTVEQGSFSAVRLTDEPIASR